MDVKWIKVVTRFYDAPKLRMLRSENKGERTLLIWLMLISLAGFCNQGGRLVLENGMAFNMKTFAKEFDFSEKTLEFAFEQFVKFNMITLEDGVYAIKNWEKYQSSDRLEQIREYNRLAKQKSRMSKKVNDMSLTCQDIEEEEEIESEKEYHSFSHARESVFDEKQRRIYLRGELGQGVVLLSDEQFDDLLDRLSLEEFEKYVGVVRDQELAGRHYKRKTHYQAILDMAEADRRLA